MTSLEKLHEWIKYQLAENDKEKLRLEAKWDVLNDMKQAVERELDAEKEKTKGSVHG
jgi:hypothetical protein